MKIEFYESQFILDSVIRTKIQQTDVIVDIGCGIYPINYFIPKVMVLIEPWHEYVKILEERYSDDSRILILQTDGLSGLKLLSDNSIDSIFLIDVIEHLDKVDGLNLIKEAERIARIQVVVFTPLGFMPQHVEIDYRDRWGLNGGRFQEHKSGWTPADFEQAWDFYVCERYHLHDDEGNPFTMPYGAFYGILNKNYSGFRKEKTYTNFFRPTAKDLKIQEVTKALEETRINYESLLFELMQIKTSTTWKASKPIRKCVEFLRTFRSSKF